MKYLEEMTDEQIEQVKAIARTFIKKCCDQYMVRR